MVHLKMLPRALLQGRSGQDALTSGLFPVSRVLFVGDSVYQECIAGWPVVEGRWVFVSTTGTLTGAANAQLESCDDITGHIRHPGHVGELEHFEEPCRRIRHSETDCATNEDLVCHSCPTEGRDS